MLGMRYCIGIVGNAILHHCACSTVTAVITIAACAAANCMGVSEMSVWFCKVLTVRQEWLGGSWL